MKFVLSLIFCFVFLFYLFSFVEFYDISYSLVFFIFCVFSSGQSTTGGIFYNLLTIPTPKDQTPILPTSSISRDIYTEFMHPQHPCTIIESTICQVGFYVM